jgi:hypothetical protein
MNIVILCKTKIKDSWVESGMKFYREYGVFTDLTNTERDHYANSPFNMRELYKWSLPVITASRKVTLKGENRLDGQWVLYDGFENIQSAAMGFGDSEYWFNSESVNDIHVQAIEKNNKVESLRHECEELEDLVNKTWLRGSTKLIDKYNELYYSELKSKKLYSKAKNGNAPKDKIEEITNRLKPEYEKELSDIQSRMDQIKKEIEEINK